MCIQIHFTSYSFTRTLSCPQSSSCTPPQENIDACGQNRAKSCKWSINYRERSTDEIREPSHHRIYTQIQVIPRENQRNSPFFCLAKDGQVPLVETKRSERVSKEQEQKGFDAVHRLIVKHLEELGQLKVWRVLLIILIHMQTNEPYFTKLARILAVMGTPREEDGRMSVELQLD
jgi:hypothetical protein